VPHFCFSIFSLIFIEIKYKRLYIHTNRILIMPTLEDIARRAMVSSSTVSRILHSPESRKTHVYSKETRRKVIQLAKELGYQPNLLARSFRTRRTHTLGFICGEVHTPHFAELTAVAHEEAERQGYSFYLAVTNWNRKKQAEELDKLLQRRVDGVLIWSCHRHEPGDRHYERIITEKLPVVLLEDRIEGMASVSSDMRTGMDEAITYLKNKGIGKVGFIGQKGLDKKTYRNHLAFIQAISEQKVEGVEYECSTQIEDAIRIGKALAHQPNRPKTVIVFSDYVTTGVIRGLIQEGVRVPEDIGIIGMDGTEMGAYYNPSLTAIFRDRRRMAKRGIELLLKMLDGNAPEQRETFLPTRLIVRESA
jgi:DNA-binding LacI/PurR family transcriptional regulator